MKKFQQYFPALLICYHLAFSYVAWRVLLLKNGDAYKYWFVGKDLSGISWTSFLNPGTDIINLFTFPLVKYLHLPFWSGFLIFSAVSGVGVWILWRLLMNLAEDRLKIVAGILLLLPNLHFWTSIPGKESVVFLILVLLLKRFLEQKVFTPVFLLLFIALVLIRPHIGAVVLAALVFALVFTAKIGVKNKVFLTIGALLLMSGVAWILKGILRGNYPLFYNIERYYRAHIKVLKHTEAYVPLDQYWLPHKIFTFWFRPLPFEKSGLLYTVLSIENTVLLLISAFAVYFAIRNFRKVIADQRVIFCGLFILFFSVMYVYGYANYGLIMRTRIMGFPFVAVLLMVALSSFRRKNS